MNSMKEQRYQNLTRIRKQKNLSMITIADKLNISTAYYCQLETKKKRLSYEMAVRIANILGMKPDDIFYEEENKKKSTFQ